VVRLRTITVARRHFIATAGVDASACKIAHGRG